MGWGSGQGRPATCRTRAVPEASRDGVGWGESEPGWREKLGEAAACKGEGIGSRNGSEWGAGAETL